MAGTLLVFVSRRRERKREKGAGTKTPGPSSFLEM
jgi:hypothetical protein